jgi:DNA-binding NarL/FixJ family response regulator
MSITVALIDDRRLVREGVRMLLSTQVDFEVVGEADDPPAGLEVIATRAPRVVVVAEEVSGAGGIAATREICRRHPEVAVLVASSGGSVDGARRALMAGARGYVLKKQPSVELFEAIRTVARGDVYLPPAIAAESTSWDTFHNGGHGNGHRHAGDSAPDEPLGILSARERQVFELLVRGHTNNSIARLLGISPKTVDTHRTKVLRKIGVHSIVDLVRFAARNQLPLD